MLARQWLVNCAESIPISIWYDWHDDGKDAKEPEHHFGTVAFDYHPGREPAYDPKPSYVAAKTLASVLGGYKFTRRIAAGLPEDYVMQFSKEGESRFAVWTTAAQAREVRVPGAGSKYDVVDHLGNKLAPISTQAQSLIVNATEAPLYLTSKSAAQPPP
jgi:hypothetical protein